MAPAPPIRHRLGLSDRAAAPPSLLHLWSLPSLSPQPSTPFQHTLVVHSYVRPPSRPRSSIGSPQGPVEHGRTPRPSTARCCGAGPIYLPMAVQSTCANALIDGSPKATSSTSTTSRSRSATRAPSYSPPPTTAPCSWSKRSWWCCRPCTPCSPAWCAVASRHALLPSYTHPDLCARLGASE